MQMKMERHWYNEAIFYHIYPLGLVGAEKQNDYGEVKHRFVEIIDLIDYIKDIGFNAIYIGPLFESVGHGYETTDYKKVDRRLGDNADFKKFVEECHKNDIKVIVDAVFNHTGRDFFAFEDLKKNKWDSQYKDWYMGVNFGGNNEFNDGFSYMTWQGVNILPKLNLKNQEVINYILDVVRFWVAEFDIDGLRLDAANVLDFGFLKQLRNLANGIKQDFWLMGEVLHERYGNYANDEMAHAVTNFKLQKALYSGHNDHNYFEIAHTMKHLVEEGVAGDGKHCLYNFADNHDVERVFTILKNKYHVNPIQILTFTLEGVPAVYYGTELGIEGKKEKGNDYALRPRISKEEYLRRADKNIYTILMKRLTEVRKNSLALSYGTYRELLLTTKQFAFVRKLDNEIVIVLVNNDDNDAPVKIPAQGILKYEDALHGKIFEVENDTLEIKIPSNYGLILKNIQ